MKIILDSSKNPLMLTGFSELAEQRKTNNDWSIKKDRMGVYMIFYQNIPVDEIIYAVGEISLALTSNITSLQKEYYDAGYGNVFNMAVKLIRDADFSKRFYTKYTELNEKL